MLSLLLILAAAALGDADCLSCHSDATLKTEAGASVHVAEDAFQKSVHAEVGCTGCHEDVRDYPHSPKVAKPDCAACHEEPPRGLAGSAHAARDGPTCRSCHGSPHAVRPASDPQSPTARANLPQTCGRCHADPAFQTRHKTAIAHPVDAYRASVHGRALLAGRPAASCADCHGTHAVQPARDARSPINRWSVPRTCGTCHGAAQKAYEASVHGQAVARGVTGAPVCTDCHGEHAILAPSEPGSLVNPARVSAVTCARCHADERLAEKYNLPLDKVPAFADSYHGLALRSGRQHVANCASCHGVHNILPRSDPASTIHPTHLAQTCGACHAGAGTRFALGPVHVADGGRSEHPVARGVRWAYLVLIPFTLGFMLLHNGSDFVGKLIRRRAVAAMGPDLPRMGLHFRIAHGMTVVSFTALVLTGFALKFPEAWWAKPMLAWEGQVAFRGLVHRIAGVVLVASLGYHAVHVLRSRRNRRFIDRMRPRWADAGDVARALRFNLGLSEVPPRLGVFSYAEKLEYWAYIWGTVVMAATGFLLWFSDFSLRHLPKWVSDVATTIHFYEAILATASIVVWHFYLVIFDPEVYPMERAWLTGLVSGEHLRHQRPRYYRALMRLVSRGRG
jgi:cytochrome b subunit of formate dehydrogenase